MAKNVMFMVADEGYPDARVISVNDEQMKDLEERFFEIAPGDDDWDTWAKIIFDDSKHIDLPCWVDATCAVLVY